MSAGAWDAMLAHEAEERRQSALERRRTLARMTKPELIDLVVAIEGKTADRENGSRNDA